MKKFNLTAEEYKSAIHEIQQKAHHCFKNMSLLDEALTHPSYAAEQAEPMKHNQRLEFLGDAVLQIVVSDFIFEQLPEAQEGMLTRVRSYLTNEQATADYTRKLELDMALKLSKGEITTGGRQRPSILGDLFESFLGAVYLDAGLEKARKLVLELIPSLDIAIQHLSYDDNPKGALQQWAQANKRGTVSYEIVSKEGPVHDPVYKVNALIGDEIVATSTGHSHKEAEKNAAFAALATLGELIPPAPVVFNDNPKGALQQWAQVNKRGEVGYQIVSQDGPEHNPTYTASVLIGDEVVATATGHSHKEAEKNAACEALSSLVGIAPTVSVAEAAPEPATTVRKKLILALDFDGVICDSAAETAASAWRAAGTLWPTRFKEKDCPKEVIGAFRKIRPYLETGYQSILMIKMMLDGMPLEAFADDLADKLQAVMDKEQLTIPQLKTLFGETRDAWITADLNGWLGFHGLYPGTIEALKAALQFHKVLILTTKQERFVQAILQSQGVDFPEANIFGLDRKQSKETVLANLVGAKKNNIHFVEDRLETLVRVRDIQSLSRVKLHYADWGYGTPQNLVDAKADKKIDVLDLQAFCDLLH